MHYLAQIAPAPDKFMAEYGPLAFGTVVLLIVLAAVWWVIIRPSQQNLEKEQAREGDERATHLEAIKQIATANMATSENLKITAGSLAQTTADQKVIAKLQDASLARADRLLERLDNMTTKAANG
jgi:type II secretory pathway component PulM